jgi:L-aspartate oxidase
MVAALDRYGVAFDRAGDGSFALGLEAAHSRRRILHVRDATGKAILDALTGQVARETTVTRVSGRARRLVTDRNGRIAGILFQSGGGTVFLPTGIVVLATGGVGGLWRSTTNPATSRGSGLALAAKAGAVLRDIEFVQFHPTALAVGADPMPLISEAVRGEGARLIDSEGEDFMAGTPGATLAPRDILARAVFAQWANGDRAALDMRHWPTGKFAARFPTIHAVLAEHGLDPGRDPIPVRPAAHYHMGGVMVNEAGRTTAPGLWAVGEVASTGLHGANRLASNSLLEAAICGKLAAEDIAGSEWPVPAASPPPAADQLPAAGAVIDAIRTVMETDVGVVRDRDGLLRAIARLGDLRREAVGTDAEDAAATALLIALSAERRIESRGAHFRADAPTAIEPPVHSTSRWSEMV